MPTKEKPRPIIYVSAATRERLAWASQRSGLSYGRIVALLVEEQLTADTLARWLSARLQEDAPCATNDAQ